MIAVWLALVPWVAASPAIPVQLPPGQPAWPAQVAGGCAFEPGAAGGSGAWLRLVDLGNGTWRMVVSDGKGGMRLEERAAPRTAAEREELLALACSLSRPSAVSVPLPPLPPPAAPAAAPSAAQAGSPAPAPPARPAPAPAPPGATADGAVAPVAVEPPDRLGPPQAPKLLSPDVRAGILETTAPGARVGGAIPLQLPPDEDPALWDLPTSCPFVITTLTNADFDSTFVRLNRGDAGTWSTDVRDRGGFARYVYEQNPPSDAEDRQAMLDLACSMLGPPVTVAQPSGQAAP